MKQVGLINNLDSYVQTQTLESDKKTLFDSFLKKGFPTTKDEEWKYTSLKKIVNLDFGSSLGTPGGPKIHRKMHEKNEQKTLPSKNNIFSQFKRFLSLPASIFIDFGTRNGCPDHRFLMIFRDRVFASIFGDFCWKKEKTQKMQK